MNEGLNRLKEEFDFLYKRVRELEWEKSVLYKDRFGGPLPEIEKINIQLDNYIENIEIVIENVKEYLEKCRKLKKPVSKS